jgi:threonine aldolase
MPMLTPIDLRSDTVTRPSAAMRAAMAAADVGDDVLGEDPTVNAFQRRIADLLGKEAALFVPTGTMANQVAVGVHAAPGDELVCDPTSHVYVWEGGGAARLSGVTTRTVAGDCGLLTVDLLRDLIRPDDGHYVRTRLICLENTHNRGGGRVQSIDQIAEVSAWARSNGLAMHLDGARLFNAAVASGVALDAWAAHFDTVSVCFSKGLGAPVGSAIVGTADTIRKAHRLRKVFGGGMRQAGILAAACLFALEHNIGRLSDDHANAALLAAAVEATPGLRLESGPVETNLVWVEVEPELGTAKQVAATLRDAGVLVSPLGPQVLRACTHLDVSREQAECAADRIRGLARR